MWYMIGIFCGLRGRSPASILRLFMRRVIRRGNGAAKGRFYAGLRCGVRIRGRIVRPQPSLAEANDDAIGRSIAAMTAAEAAEAQAVIEAALGEGQSS